MTHLLSFDRWVKVDWVKLSIVCGWLPQVAQSEQTCHCCLYTAISIYCQLSTALFMHHVNLIIDNPRIVIYVGYGIDGGE